MAEILYLGNYTRTYSTETHIARELEGLGHHVQRVQETSRLDRNYRVLRRRLDAHVRPDLMLWTRTWGIMPDAVGLWREFEARGAITCSYHLDLYIGLKRENTIPADPFWRTQHVFTADGDPQAQERFAELGINHHWMPPAVVSDEAIPGRWRAEYAHDVIFVGSGSKHHHNADYPFRTRLLMHLEARHGKHFQHYGRDVGTIVRDSNLNDLYASAKVVVGDSVQLPGRIRYTSDRLFETIGRGGFLLWPRMPWLDDLGFVDGKHYVTWQGLADLDEKIGWALRHQDECREIAAAGQAFVAAEHTYRDRLRTTLEQIGLG